MSDKKYKTEWSFSFDDIGKKINDTINSIVNDESVEVQEAHFEAELDGAQSAKIQVDLGLSLLNIAALDADSTQLATVDMTYVGDVQFDVNGEAEKTVSLTQKHPKRDVVGSLKRAVKSMSMREDIKAELRLSPAVPLSLDIDAGVAPSTVDLTGLTVTSIDLDCGVGTMNLTLPHSDTDYRASIDSGVGSTDIAVPDGTPLHLDINAGVGSLNLYLPDNVAARLTINGGLGGVSIPDYFDKVQSGDEFLTKSGVWETAGFAVAEKQVFVDFAGGVGNFKVRVGEKPAEKVKAKRKSKGKVKVNINVDADADNISEAPTETED